MANTSKFGKPDRSTWLYWETGLLTSMLATAASIPDTPAHLAYGLVSMLFLLGLIRA